MSTTKVQISLHIRTVWLASMLFAALIVQLHNIHSTHILSFKTLASVAELAGLNLNRSQTPKDVFSRDMAQLAFHFLNYYSTDTENSGINMFFTYKQPGCSYSLIWNLLIANLEQLSSDRKCNLQHKVLVQVDKTDSVEFLWTPDFEFYTQILVSDSSFLQSPY